MDESDAEQQPPSQPVLVQRLGHATESFRDPRFLAHLLAGTRSAAGQTAARCNPGSQPTSVPRRVRPRRAVFAVIGVVGWR
jgi:hypothetical protein